MAVQPARLTAISSSGRKPSFAPPTSASAPSGTSKPVSAVPVKCISLVARSLLRPFHFSKSGVTYFSRVAWLTCSRPAHAQGALLVNHVGTGQIPVLESIQRDAALGPARPEMSIQAAGQNRSR